MGQQAKTTKVGAVHAHATVSLTVRVGQGCPNEGFPFTFETLSSINYTNAPKDVAIKGNQIAVVTRAVADSDPKWDGEISKNEWDKLVVFMGDGYMTFFCDITVTWRVPGMSATNDNIEGCFIGSGDLSSKSGDAVMVKVGSGACLVLTNGVQPFVTGDA